MLNLTCFSLCCVEDDRSANEIDDDEECQSCAYETLCCILAPGQADSKQELEDPHQEEHSCNLVTSKLPLLVIAEKTKHAHDSGNKHNLSSQVECFGSASELSVVRVADGCESAIELEGVAEESTKGLMLCKLFNFVGIFSLSCHS